MKRSTRVAAALAPAAAIALLVCVATAYADGPGDPTAVKQEDGKWLDKEGNPTFKVDQGKVDFYSFIGYTRYTANCMQCHGPDGLGSTYGPALTDSLKHLGYNEVVATVASGKKDVSSSSNLVMPALGDNKNVMCYLDPIYVYLRGRSDGAIPRGRPEQHEPKPEAFQKAEDACMG